MNYRYWASAVAWRCILPTHVYVLSDHDLPEMNEAEEEMLEQVFL